MKKLIDKGILVLKSDLRAHAKLETYLRGRNWEVLSFVDVRVMINHVMDAAELPQYALVCLDHSQKQASILPNILRDRFSLKVIGYFDKAAADAQFTLDKLNLKYCLSGVPSGPSVERIISRMTLDLERQDKDQKAGGSKRERLQTQEDEVISVKGGKGLKKDAKFERIKTAETKGYAPLPPQDENKKVPLIFMERAHGLSIESPRVNISQNRVESDAENDPSVDEENSAERSESVDDLLNQFSPQTTGKERSMESAAAKPTPEKSAKESAAETASKTGGGHGDGQGDRMAGKEPKEPLRPEVQLGPTADAFDALEATELELEKARRAQEEAERSQTQKGSRKSKSQAESSARDNPPSAEKDGGATSGRSANSQDSAPAKNNADVGASQRSDKTTGAGTQQKASESSAPSEPSGSLEARSGSLGGVIQMGQAKAQKRIIDKPTSRHPLGRVIEESLLKCSGVVVVDSMVDRRPTTELYCLQIASTGYIGYLLMYSALDLKALVLPNGNTFLSEVASHLYEGLYVNGMTSRYHGSIFTVDVPKLVFQEWATTDSGLLITANVNEKENLAEVGFSFLANEQAVSLPKAEHGFFKFAVEEFMGEKTVEFGLYLYLATNQKFFLYTREGRVLYENQIERLLARGIKEFYVREDNAALFLNFRARVVLGRGLGPVNDLILRSKTGR